MLQVCGANCEECPAFQKECQGCHVLQGKVYWVEFIGQEVCPVYQCCQDKGLAHCGGCTEMPCKTWYELKDPNWSEEEHLASINYRVNALKG